jgi:endonuclease V-like protein UPF0215 family
MKTLGYLLNNNKNIRVIGFDDTPFDTLSTDAQMVNICGVVCNTTKFEGMLWGEVLKDGTDATSVVIDIMEKSKFNDQVHAILFDGIAFGGFNILDITLINERLRRPCIAVMRGIPDFKRIGQAIDNVHSSEVRTALIEKAGTVYSINTYHFQVKGCTPDDAALLLQRVTENGNVPEALRIAHLIGSAVKTGQSGKRA